MTKPLYFAPCAYRPEWPSHQDQDCPHWMRYDSLSLGFGYYSAANGNETQNRALGKANAEGFENFVGRLATVFYGTT